MITTHPPGVSSSLVLILNTHIPQVVQEPGAPLFDEQENWLFEAMTETYVPLFRMLAEMRPIPLGCRLILSFTPCLVDQLMTSLDRYREFLGLMRTIALAEVDRTRSVAAFNRPQKHPLPLTDVDLELLRKTAAMYLARISQAIDYLDRYPDFLAPLRDRDDIELWTSCTNHSFLPFYRPSTAEYLVRRGIERFEAVWGRAPDGFWLPECGYVPELADILLRSGIRRTALSLRAIGPYDDSSMSGMYQYRGLDVLIHDFRLAMKVWKARKHTLPSNPIYREFYRDMGFDVVPAYLTRLGIPAQAVQQRGGMWSGFKYHAITGSETDLGSKRLYDVTAARRQAATDAEGFIAFLNSSRHLANDSETCVLAFDTEIFGHWWLEGAQWLEEVIRHHA